MVPMMIATMVLLNRTPEAAHENEGFTVTRHGMANPLPN